MSVFSCRNFWFFLSIFIKIESNSHTNIAIFKISINLKYQTINNVYRFTLSLMHLDLI